MKFNLDFVFSYSWIATIAYFIVVPLMESDFLASLIWAPVVCLSLIFCLMNSKENSTKTKVICVIFCFIVFFEYEKLEMSHYVSMICFLNNLLFMSLCSNMTISNNTKKLIKICIICIAILFVLYSFTPIASKVVDDGVYRVTSTYAFNLGNANAAGIFLFLIFGILFIFTFEADSFLKKTFFRILDIYIVYLIYKTGARSCLIGVVALLLIGLLYGNKKINKFIIYAVTLVPIIFMFFLTNLYNSGYSDVEILGKSIFTGREVYFQSCIDTINTPLKWAIGDFGWWGLNNAHNAPLAILLSFGVVGVFLVYLVYYDTMLKINKETNRGKVKTICVVCVLCLFVESIAEASLFLGGFPVVNFIGTMIILAKESTEEKFEREEKHLNTIT